MSLRNLRQSEFANIFLDSERFFILYLCPRMGKIKISINIFNGLNSTQPDILICFPDKKIEASWKEDFKKFGYENPNVTFTTYLSLHKHKDKVFDLVVCDEIHLLSENQIVTCKYLFKKNSCVLGLTGTLSSWTKKTLKDGLGLKVLAEYSIEQAIEEDIVTDYEISVIKVPLDNVTRQLHIGKYVTEKQRFNSTTWVINKLEKEGKPSFFMKLKLIRILQNSISRTLRTKQLLQELSDKRVLVFSGNTTIADSLDIPSYHSKSKDKQLFEDFASGKGNQLSVCKIGGTGVNFKPLNYVIINHFSSSSEELVQRVNRCMSMEYDNLDKKAKIFLIMSTEAIEEKWSKSALSMFNKEKIKYL